MENYKTVKAAAAQLSPVFPFNKKKTIDKVVDYVEEAGSKNADIIAFPECFIPAYPNWSIDFDDPARWEEELADFTLQCVNIENGDLEKIQQVAKKHKMVVVVGMNEVVSNYEGVIYNSLATINEDGDIANVHRKLFPSNREKLFHARGDATTLNVVDTNIGRVGGLICYEHLQPLLKYSLISQGEHIHCASWPGWPNFKNGRSNIGIVETASKAYALEGQCFIIAASYYVPPEEAEKANLHHASWDFFGGSAIISPSGEYLAGPIYDQEGIIYADLDFSHITKRKASVDTTGRDSYPEGLSLLINRKGRSFQVEEK